MQFRFVCSLGNEIINKEDIEHAQMFLLSKDETILEIERKFMPCEIEDARGSCVYVF